jgi:dihydrolipoamide dehydrogenase
MDLRCDVAIIGGGTAGLAAERSARTAGASTLIIDPVFAGTTCATVGCMPSKLLIAAAGAAHAVRQAATFGVNAACEIDGAAVMKRVRDERDRFARGARDEIAKLPDGTMVRAKAQFRDATTLLLDDGRTVVARAFVIATGARPTVPAIFDPIADLVLTNETVFDLQALPRSLAVIGAGPLGLELAQAMARLGVRVTLLDKSDTLAALEDEPVAALLKDVLSRDMAIALGVEIEATLRGGKALLRWTGEASGESEFDHVLVAAGRPPSLDGLDLKVTGLELDKHGVPAFDRETLRCGDSAIFIAGDADADRPVLHEASAEGAIAGYNAARYPDVKPARRCVPFSIMFTDPPLAVIGRTDTKALVTGVAEYRDQGRAKVQACAEGLARLHADPGDGRLLGATLFCPGADHLGHLLAWSVEDGLTADALLQRPFYHPTFEEGLKPALRTICEAVGVNPPDSSDQGAPAGA